MVLAWSMGRGGYIGGGARVLGGKSVAPAVRRCRWSMAKMGAVMRCRSRVARGSGTVAAAETHRRAPVAAPAGPDGVPAAPAPGNAGSSRLV